MKLALALGLAYIGSIAHSLTFEQRAPKTYIGDVTNADGIEPNDMRLVNKDNALFLTFGTDLSKKIMDTARANCKDPESEGCKTKMQDVMGIGPGNNGLQSRTIGAIQAGGPVIAIVYYKLTTYLWDLIEGEHDFKVVELKLPHDQETNLEQWDPEEYKFEYKPFEKDPVEVFIDGTLPDPGSNPPGVTKEQDGSLTVNLPGLVTPIQDAFKKVICKRDSLNKRVTMACLVQFAQQIMRIAQIGGPAQGIQYISPEDFPKPKNELLIEALEQDREYEDMMIYGKGLDEDARRNVADFSTWMAFSVTVGELDFSGDKLKIPASFLETQGETTEDDPKCPEQRLTPFCVNCGGNASPQENNGLAGNCKGFGDKLMYKGCQCWLASDPGFRIQPDDLKEKYQYLNSLPNEDDGSDDPPQEPKEELRCADPNNSPGAYVSQGAMERHAETFCNSVTMGIGLVNKPDIGFEYETDTYDGSYLYVKSDGLLLVDQCKERFYKIINDCVPADNNPMNWKFGGEYEIDGAFYKINVAGHAVNRFVETDGGPMHSVRASCQGSKSAFNDAFYIRGAGWESGNFGKTLITKLRECMGSNPTNWKFNYFDNPDSDWLEWYATGDTTIGQMDNCFAHAVRVSGGPTDATCQTIDCHSEPFQVVCG